METKSFTSTLEEILKMYGGTKYKDVTLDQLKNSICEKLEDISIHSPAEKALVIKMTSKVKKCKNAEQILTEITEKMFSLSGQ